MADQRQPIVHVDHRPAYTHLSRAELGGVSLLHRLEVPVDTPPVLKGPYDTVHKNSYPQYPRQPKDEPMFTIGAKNALGTSVTKSRVTLNQLRLGQIQLVGPGAKSSWSTTQGSQFPPPDMDDRFRGRSAVRQGVAARMPYSEVERNFGSLDSTGTLPGERAFGGKFDTLSEHQQHFAHPGVQPKRQPEFTLRWSNDLGTGTIASVVPPTMLNATHFDFGTYGAREGETLYATSTATQFPSHSVYPDPKVPKAGVGTNAGLGPSAVNRGFRENINSETCNLITNRERLGGEHYNTEAFKAARSTVGHHQQPAVDPRLRGATGRRMSYDIVTGVDRPAGQWGAGIAPPPDMRDAYLGRGINRRPDLDPHLATAPRFASPPPRCERAGSLASTRPY